MYRRIQALPMPLVCRDARVRVKVGLFLELELHGYIGLHCLPHLPANRPSLFHLSRPSHRHHCL